MTETGTAAGPPAPIVSVIVTTYERPAFLAEALESVRVQTMPDFECIVVDDASPTLVVLPVSDSRFRLLRRDTNGGAGAARNTGLALARGAGVVFLDDDDIFTPERLQIAADLLARGAIGVCGMSQVGSAETSPPTLSGWVSDVVLESTTPHLGVTTVRRDVCLPFDESYRTCEDLDWWLRMTTAMPVMDDPRVGWLWRPHIGPRGMGGAAQRISDSLKLLVDHAEYFRTHRRSAAFRWLRISLLAAQTGASRTRWTAAARAIRLDPRPKRVLRAVKAATWPLPVRGRR